MLLLGAVVMLLSVSACSGSGASNLTDREALTVIFEKMNGKNWVEDTTNWCSNAPLNDWEGVEAETDANGVERVVKLELRDDSLKGNIPAEIGCLTELKELTISTHDYEADVTNAVPAELWTLAKMEEMSLYLNGKGFYKLPEKIDMPAIKELTLKNVEAPFDAITKLTTLEELEMDNFKGEIPESVGELTNLETMKWCSGEEAVGRVPAAVGKMAKLKKLTVDYSQFIGGPSQAKADFPVEIWDNPNLEYIFLRNVASNPSTLPAEKIAAMVNLKSLILCRCGIEGTIPVEFFKNGKLTTFEIYENNLTGTIPAEICNCTDLTSIMLQKNNLSGEIPANIGNCTKLTTLWLYDNANLGGAIPASIAKCEKLIIFGLKGTKVSQSVPAAVQGNKNYSKWHLWD